jgi:diguanylate cyclase (GGDEF)-like protein/PAS domain S-box-containing protein
MIDQFVCQTIVNSLPQHIFIKDTDSRYLYCNQAYAELLETTADAIVGKTDLDFFPNEIAEKYRGDDQMLLVEQRTIDVNEMIVVGGKKMMIRTVKKPIIVNGDVLGILGTFWDITHVYERERELQEIKVGLIQAQELAHIGHWELNLERNSLYWSDEVYRIFGLKPQEFGATYEAFLEFVHPDDLEMVKEAYSSSVAEKRDYQIAHRVLTKDGEVRYVEEHCSHDYDRDGNVMRSIGTVHDITEQKLAQERLLLTAKVVENTTNGVLITDAHQKIVYVNDALCRISGYSSEELKGEYPTLLSSGWHDEAFYTKMWKSIEESGQWYGEIRDRRKNGEHYIAEISIFVLKNEAGTITNYIAISDDITEKKEKEELIHSLAYYDSLTDLPNRVLFKQKFNDAIENAKQEESRCALLFFDLDNFKNINDTLGHIVGDRLLKAVADRLKKVLRKEDMLSRIGGDEFTVIIHQGEDPVEIAHIAEQINAAVAVPFAIDNNELFIGASIGISIYPTDGEDSDELVKAADTAMYHVKDTGKSSYQFFTEELNQMTTERLMIENELRHATQRNEMFLVYQPKIDLNTGQVYGMEALLRWNHPQMGFIPPDKFIPIAEETGQINQIGTWVALQAMLDTRRLHLAGFGELVVSVNVSSVQVAQENFVSVLLSTLLNTEIEKAKVEIEITESSLMQQVEEVMEKLKAINEYGVKLSIDDFGTGYSSLSYLKKLPVQTLKIDRSFIDDIVNDADDRSITSSIISLAHNMGMEVVAEGTENLEQIAVLRELGCEKAQGYYYARPMPYNEFFAWIKANGGAV